jgi:hypothetical protein
MIADKQKRQAFEANKLKVSRQIWMTIPVLLERVNFLHGMMRLALRQI